MHLIDEDFKPIVSPKNNKGYSEFLFWEYNATKRRFGLTKQDTWFMIHSDAYRISVGKYMIDLPVNHYLLIGDFDAGLDFIKMDEVIGRDFQVLTFNADLEPDSWQLVDLKILGIKTDFRTAYPQTKKPVAIHLGDNKAIMVSSVDAYSKMSELSFGDIV